MKRLLLNFGACTERLPEPEDKKQSGYTKGNRLLQKSYQMGALLDSILPGSYPFRGGRG